MEGYTMKPGRHFILFPTTALPASGSMGIISACEFFTSTPVYSAAKEKKIGDKSNRYYYFFFIVHSVNAYLGRLGNVMFEGDRARGEGFAFR